MLGSEGGAEAEIQGSRVQALQALRPGAGLHA
jgi:hypothetical protein